MKLLAKKLDSKETRIPVNGLKQVIYSTQFEIEYEDQVDVIWIMDSNIINMEPIDMDIGLYEIEVDSEYLALLLDSQE